MSQSFVSTDGAHGGDRVIHFLFVSDAQALTWYHNCLLEIVVLFDFVFRREDAQVCAR